MFRPVYEMGRNNEPTTVVGVLVEQVFCRLGMPIAEVTDRGKEMDGNLMREVSTRCGPRLTERQITQQLNAFTER